nr:hypothetical protein Iba_scaffold43122CG0010 [Ipomoea batatas]GMD30006.1 hypothetical protein Iba_scaffold43455CG0010 [Ipomoea batatas]GME00255.1 hypothetical protein Iba_chr15fCG3640 [Ipomoea batatas]GME14491.1 hypothetical protein Iba_scaffold15256CG0010 [Ipomoea batatas]
MAADHQSSLPGVCAAAFAGRPPLNRQCCCQSREFVLRRQIASKKDNGSSTPLLLEFLIGLPNLSTPLVCRGFFEEAAGDRWSCRCVATFTGVLAEADDRKLPVPKSRGHRNFRCQRCWLPGLHRRTLSSTVNKSPEITELLRRCFRRCRSPELLSRLFSPMLALYRIAFFVVVGLYAEALFLYCRVAHAWSSSVDVARSSLKAHVGASPLTRRHYEISAGIALSLKPLEFLAVNAA